MKIRKLVPSGTRLGKPAEYHIIRKSGCNYHPETNRITDVSIQLENDQNLILSWSEIEFFADIYHKNKDRA